MFGTSNYDNLIVGILGKKKQGKTTLMKHFLLIELLKNKDVLLYFPNDFYNTEKNIYRLIVEGALNFDTVSTYIKEYMLQNKQELSIFIDEMDMLGGEKDLAFVFNFARNFRSNIFYIAKRTANISKRAVSQTDRFYVFKNTELNDLKRLKYINEKLFELAPKLKQFQAYVIEDNDIVDFIELNLDISKMERMILDLLVNIEKEEKELISF